jgi:hypothetical protein
MIDSLIHNVFVQRKKSIAMLTVDRRIFQRRCCIRQEYGEVGERFSEYEGFYASKESAAAQRRTKELRGDRAECALRSEGGGSLRVHGKVSEKKAEPS